MLVVSEAKLYCWCYSSIPWGRSPLEVRVLPVFPYPIPEYEIYLHAHTERPKPRWSSVWKLITIRPSNISGQKLDEMILFLLLYMQESSWRYRAPNKIIIIYSVTGLLHRAAVLLILVYVFFRVSATGGRNVRWEELEIDLFDWSDWPKFLTKQASSHHRYCLIPNLKIWKRPWTNLSCLHCHSRKRSIIEKDINSGVAHSSPLFLLSIIFLHNVFICYA